MWHTDADHRYYLTPAHRTGRRRHLADIGMRIAVDDFGSGYSSLAQLLRLPVSVLK